MDDERQPEATDADATDNAADQPIDGSAGTDWPAEDLGQQAATDDGMAMAADDAEPSDVAEATDDREPTDDALVSTDADDEPEADDDSDAPIELDASPEAPAPDVAIHGADHVRAENVTISQGGAQTVEADTVSITQGGASRVRAEQFNISQGGVALARTESLTIESQGSAFAVMSEDANIEAGSNVFLVVSRSFSGDVQPSVDWRTALAFGAGVGLVISILRHLR